MSPLRPRNERRPVFTAIAQWWRRWTGGKLAPTKFSGPDETKDITQELGLSASQPLSIFQPRPLRLQSPGTAHGGAKS